MPTDIALVVTGIAVAFVFFAGMLLFADITWKPRK
jgi:hypothetical protein